jgi:uncharacterized protein (DUF885 family)
MNRILFLLALSAIVVMTSPSQAADLDPADQKLEAFFRNYLEEVFKLRPLDATQLGDHRFDSQLDDISPEARAGWLALDKRRLAALPKEVAFDALSADGKVSYGILRDELARSIWLAENTRRFEEDPRVYGGYISDCVFSLLTQSTLPKETNITNAIARMAHIPRITATAKTTITVPPPSVLETAVLQNRGAIHFYEHELFTLVGDTPQLADLKKAAEPVVAALREHQKFLETEVRPRATGQWRLGKEKFSRKLELVLDAGMSADEVLAAAEAELNRVRNDMYVVARQLWSKHFPKHPLPPDDTAGRAETVREVLRKVGENHGPPERLIADARATVGQIKTFIQERDILRLPEPDRCLILEMPEFRRGNSAAYLDPALPLDPLGSSTYAVSPPPADWSAARIRSFLEEYNHHMLQILTIHEAYPGHYVQLEYANRHKSLIRRALGSGVFAEGWAVYTEQMMLDQGYGDGDLELRLNQLKFFLRTVANAILDHKMHCTELSDEAALNFLMDDAFQSEGEARLKIIRAKQSSVQLSTYFVGRTAFYNLRQRIQRDLGDKFDLGRYHEAVLSHGSVPVKYLPELVRRRLAEPR